MSWRAFWAGCWFGCETLRERGATGAYLFVCEKCGTRREVLKGQTLRVRVASKVLQMPERRKRA